MQDRIKPFNNSPKKGKTVVKEEEWDGSLEWEDSTTAIEENEDEVYWSHFQSYGPGELRDITPQPPILKSPLPDPTEVLHREYRETNPSSGNTAYVIFGNHDEDGVYYNWSSCSYQLASEYEVKGLKKPFYKGFQSESVAEALWQEFFVTGIIPAHLRKHATTSVATPPKRHRAMSPLIAHPTRDRFSPLSPVTPISSKRLLSPRALRAPTPQRLTTSFSRNNSIRPESPVASSSCTVQDDPFYYGTSPHVTVRKGPVQTRYTSVPPPQHSSPVQTRQTSVPLKEAPGLLYNCIQVRNMTAERWTKSQGVQTSIPEGADEYIVVLEGPALGVYASLKEYLSIIETKEVQGVVYRVLDRTLALQMFTESYMRGFLVA